jgi:hypothetical protein
MPDLLPPISRMGWGWGIGWLGPPLSLILANAQVGAGGKGQPIQMTKLTYFRVRPKLYVQNLSSLT